MIALDFAFVLQILFISAAVMVTIGWKKCYLKWYKKVL